MRRVRAAAVVLVLALAGAPAAAQDDVEVRRLGGADRVATAVAVSQATFAAADAAVLARADDFADALVGGPLAAHLDAPILLTNRDALDPAVSDELDRLGVRRVVILGGAAAIDPAVDQQLGDREVERVAGDDRFGTAAAVAAALPAAAEVLVATGDAFADALAAAALASATPSVAPVLLVTRDVLPAATEQALAAHDPDTITIVGGTAAVGPGVEAALADDRASVARVVGHDRYATAAAARDAAVAAGADAGDLWIADGRGFADALVAGPAIAATGGSLLLVDGGHLALATAPYDRLRAAAPSLRRVTLLGGPAAISADAPAQLDGILHGPELPGGGRLLFPHRRLVGLYGNDRSAALGALGEQPPDAAAARLTQVAEPFGAGDRPVLGTFELIATIATRGPGADGLYRAPSDPAHVQRYLDAARAHGLYLLLDLQPGRSDFLTEARRYESFLRQPDVGLALDPEWRMGPDQVPGDGVGQVSAAEVNAVLDYVAGLVAEERLPEKLVVVHQFQTRMVTERDTLREPAGLAVMIHMDGFGTRAQKMSTYDAVAIEPPFHNGFKLFYDEDVDIFQPAEVLAFERVPEVITYQ